MSSFTHAVDWIADGPLLAIINANGGEKENL